MDWSAYDKFLGGRVSPGDDILKGLKEDVMAKDTIDPTMVPQYYLMNPDNEALLHDGEEIEKGMVVLVDDHRLRGAVLDRDVVSVYGPSAPLPAMVTNRWCRVIDVVKEKTEVRFIGVYADGAMKQRRYDIRVAWIVKVDSIPE